MKLLRILISAIALAGATSAAAAPLLLPPLTNWSRSGPAVTAEVATVRFILGANQPASITSPAIAVPARQLVRLTFSAELPAGTSLRIEATEHNAAGAVVGDRSLFPLFARDSPGGETINDCHTSLVTHGRTASLVLSVQAGRSAAGTAVVTVASLRLENGGLPADPIAHTNVLQNSSFESYADWTPLFTGGSDYWRVFPGYPLDVLVVRDAAQAHTGQVCLCLTNPWNLDGTPHPNGHFNQYFQPQLGWCYRYSVWARGAGRFRFYLAQHARRGGRWVGAFYSAPQTVGPTWQRFDVLVPSDNEYSLCDTAGLMLEDGMIWIDDFEVTPVSWQEW